MRKKTEKTRVEKAANDLLFVCESFCEYAEEWVLEGSLSNTHLLALKAVEKATGKRFPALDWHQDVEPIEAHGIER